MFGRLHPTLQEALRGELWVRALCSRGSSLRVLTGPAHVLLHTPNGQQEVGLVPLGLPGSAHGVWWEDWTTGQQAGLLGVGWSGAGGGIRGLSIMTHVHGIQQSLRENQGGS